MSSESTRDYKRLATTAKRRRAELGLALNDVNSAAGGLSNRTWQRVEKGLPIRDTNYVKIDALLGWTPGSCLRILEGGDATPALEGAEVELQTSRVSREDVGQQARDTVQLALIATAKGTSAEEIRAMSERVVQDLRERGLI
jgi:hypothetical protein